MILHARHLFRRTVFVLFFSAAGFSSPAAVSQVQPSDFREFLSNYTGKEILLISTTADSLQFDDADSTQKYVVVLDEVGSDLMFLHRMTDGERRSFTYPIADIRRITFLFGTRPYRRIVVETF